MPHCYHTINLQVNRQRFKFSLSSTPRPYNQSSPLSGDNLPPCYFHGILFPWEPRCTVSLDNMIEKGGSPERAVMPASGLPFKPSLYVLGVHAPWHAFLVFPAYVLGRLQVSVFFLAVLGFSQIFHRFSGSLMRPARSEGGEERRMAAELS
jgi:hypothetical protein